MRRCLALFTLAALSSAAAAAVSPPLPKPSGAKVLLRRTAARANAALDTVAPSSSGVSACERLAHVVILYCSTRDAFVSIRLDQWSAERTVDTNDLRGSILRKRRRAAQVGTLLGTGYTPRIVFLAGAMLRSLQMATRIRWFFNPSLGYAAGATLAASFAKREWLSAIMVGRGERVLVGRGGSGKASVV